jgi:hypothetical protein
MTSVITSTYNNYVVYVNGLNFSAGADLRAVFSQDNGSTWLTSNDYYGWIHASTPSTTATPAITYTGNTAGATSAYMKLGTAVTFGNLDGEIKLCSPNTGGPNSKYVFSTLGSISTSTVFTTQGATGSALNSFPSGAVNAFRVYPSTGTFSGTILIYGVKP